MTSAFQRSFQIILFACLLIGVFVFGLVLKPYVEIFISTDHHRVNNVFSRNAIQDEARRLAVNGNYQEALLKYQEAIQPQYINREYQKATAMGAMIKIHLWLQDYDAALHKLSWFFANSATGKPTESALEKKDEINALKAYQLNNQPGMIKAYIMRFVVKHQNEMPPVKYVSGSATLISTVLRLYNTIGDHDAGIEFIDICREYFKQQDIQRYGEYRPGHNDGEYMKVREGFERDKSEGFRGCAGKKPGEVCMGHATKALIESDYFPW